jgi:hypothetical protein
MKLNLGCHVDWRIGYLNVDIDHYCDLVQFAEGMGCPLPSSQVEFMRYDLREGWPWPAACADEMLANELLEHFTFDEATHVLQEARRVLTGGGVLRGTSPDFRRVWQLMEEGYQWDEPDDEVGIHGGYCEPGQNAINNFAFGWGHQQIWTPEMLRQRLEIVGPNVVIEPLGRWKMHFEVAKEE